MKKVAIYLCFLLLLSACTIKVGGEEFFSCIDEMEQELNQPNWEKLSSKANEIKELYKKSKWKIQLIGDEGEYEGLDESINNLIASIKEKDTTNTRMELATIRTIIEDIYSL